MAPEHEDAAERLLGRCGVMLSFNKQPPAGSEEHLIYWNACVFDQAGTQIWFGDLDLTVREAQLRALAAEVGTVWVTPEMPWRFDGFATTFESAYDRARAIEFTAAGPVPAR